MFCIFSIGSVYPYQYLIDVCKPLKLSNKKKIQFSREENGFVSTDNKLKIPVHLTELTFIHLEQVVQYTYTDYRRQNGTVHQMKNHLPVGLM